LSSTEEGIIQLFIDQGIPQDVINEYIRQAEEKADGLEQSLKDRREKQARQKQRNDEVKKQVNNARKGFKRAAHGVGRG
jgi:uncharacterized protein YhaN